jgi:branched-chain amino acid aminotransferase
VDVYLNGRWLDEAAASIPIDDRGFLYADAVYETARLHQGRFFRLAQHIDRLAASAATLRIDVPSADQVLDIARDLARRSGLEDATFRITVSRAAGPDRPGTVLATLRPVPADWRERAARGWTVITAATRRPSTASIPAHIKSPGRPYALLARLEADGAGVDDALLLDDRGHVSEGPTWNVFWRKGRRLFTPSTACGVLHGVTRAAILDLAAAAGLDAQEGRYQRSELDDADEAFATMSSLGVVPIRTLDGAPLRRTGHAAADLQRRYWDLVTAELSA